MDSVAREAPLVSVIIPTYNRRRYVQLAIDSALAQTYPNIEVVVVDDGSTDGTEAALYRYTDKVKYIRQDNQGESVARNTAIDASEGAYIALLDSDDLWRPEKIERQVAHLRANPDIALNSCHVSVVDADGAVISDGPTHPEQSGDRVTMETLVLCSPVHASTITVRRQCLEEIGLFDTTIRYGEDWDLCLRVARKYQVGFVVGRPLALIRAHESAQSRSPLSPTEAQLRLADWDAVIHKNLYGVGNDGEDLGRLRVAALAQRRARIAVLDFGYGNHSSGKARLKQVLELAPEDWSDGARATEMLYQRAINVAKDTSQDAAVRLVEAFFSHLPSEVGHWRNRYRRKVLGRLHVELAFHHYSMCDYALVPRAALKAFCHSPRSIASVGLVSITVRSLGAATRHNSR